MPKTRTNQEWLHDLTSTGSIQDAAVVDLRDILLRAALYFFSRNLGDFRGLSRDEILQRADVRQRLEAVGFSPNTQSLDAAAGFLRGELDRWSRMVKAIGLAIR